MRDWLEKAEGYAFAGPLLVNESGKIDITCARDLLTPARFMLEQVLFDLGMPLGQLRQRSKRRAIRKQTAGPVPCISGACMMTTRTAIQELGLLEESYPLYFEDLEWCHRAARLGLLIGFLPEAVITHKGDQSISGMRFAARQKEYQSAVRYFSEYYPFPAWQQRLLHMTVSLGYSLKYLAFRFTGAKDPAKVYQNLISWIRTVSPEGLLSQEHTGEVQAKHS